MTVVTVGSRKKLHAIDITEKVSDALQKSTEGLVHLFSPHSTVAIMICEFEPKLARDLERAAALLLDGCGPFEHDDNNNPNAPAHILSGISGVSVTIPVHEGELQLGKYQKIVLLELDGPKERRIQIYYTLSHQTV